MVNQWRTIYWTCTRDRGLSRDRVSKLNAVCGEIGDGAWCEHHDGEDDGRGDAVQHRHSVRVLIVAELCYGATKKDPPESSWMPIPLLGDRPSTSRSDEDIHLMQARAERVRFAHFRFLMGAKPDCGKQGRAIKFAPWKRRHPLMRVQVAPNSELLQTGGY